MSTGLTIGQVVPIHLYFSSRILDNHLSFLFACFFCFSWIFFLTILGFSLICSEHNYINRAMQYSSYFKMSLITNMSHSPSMIYSISTFYYFYIYFMCMVILPACIYVHTCMAWYSQIISRVLNFRSSYLSSWDYRPVLPDLAGPYGWDDSVSGNTPLGSSSDRVILVLHFSFYY